MSVNKLIKSVVAQKQALEALHLKAFGATPSELASLRDQHLKIDGHTAKLAEGLYNAGLWVPPTGKPPIDPNPLPPGTLPISTEAITEFPELADGNDILSAMQAVEAKWAGKAVPPVVDVFVGGVGGGVAFGLDGWADIPRYNCDWLGDSTVRVIGHKAKYRVTHGDENTFIVRPTDKWQARIHFHNLMAESSERNLIDAGFYGSAKMRPVYDLRFVDCDWIEGPDRCNRPGSFNQMQGAMIRCTITQPNSREHIWYRRNSFGWFVVYQCTVVGAGAQILQEVERPEEGPDMAPGITYMIESDFTDFHKDPSRSGSALTLAGAGRDYILDRILVEDLEQSDDVYGALVGYDGGEHYNLPSGKANGSLAITNSVFNLGLGNRDLASVRDWEAFTCYDTQWNSANQKPVKVENTDSFDWNANNGNTSLITTPPGAATAMSPVSASTNWGI